MVSGNDSLGGSLYPQKGTVKPGFNEPHYSESRDIANSIARLIQIYIQYSLFPRLNEFRYFDLAAATYYLINSL